MRDIEEAAQAVSGGMVGQRDAIAMAAGGHPQLVEAVSSCLIDLVMYHSRVQFCMFLSWELTMSLTWMIFVFRRLHGASTLGNGESM